MNKIVDDVSIDESVILKCPMRSFQYVRAAKVCIICPGFNGIAEFALKEGEKFTDDAPWHARYMIRCAGVVERRVEPDNKVIEE